MEYQDSKTFCMKCGAEIHNDAVICPSCGCSTSKALKREHEKKINFFGVFACAMLIVSTLLPYAETALVSINLISRQDGIIFLVLAVIGIVCSVAGQNTVLLIDGAVIGVLSIVENQNTDKLFDSLNYLQSYLVSYGVGYYLLYVVSVLIVIAGIVGIVNNRK